MRRTQRRRVAVSSPTPGDDNSLYLGWAQWTGTASYVGDVVTAQVQQHVTAYPNEVVMLNVGACAELIGGDWSEQSVLPPGVTPQTDEETGLDAIWVGSSSPWGIDASGTPYFDDQGASPGEAVHMFLDNTGKPYLST